MNLLRLLQRNLTFFKIPVGACYTSSAEVLSIHENEGIKTVTMNNPTKRNVLSHHMIEQLQENISDDNKNLRCIILKSSGPVFCSGHDLRELHTSSAEERSEIFEKCSELMLSIQQVPIPIIAQVRGLAAAAGCQLVASCDIVVASESASFSTPGASVGLFCSTPGIAVSRVLPPKIASYMLLTGNPISAEEAYTFGLISRLTSDEELDDITKQVVQAIIAKSRSVIELGKKFYYHQREQSIETAYRDGCKIMVHNLGKNDANEGICAFIEKRKPRWTHT